MRDEVVWIPTPDGERLCATVYLPDGDGPLATLLEALPYRQHDVTDSYRPAYRTFTEAGFAVCRLDIRGTGSSSGIAPDEYADVERADLRATIEWLAAQPWSNGKVGMFGTSYSGFNSLHMAMEGVPALGAVVATYATDDRYTDDVHYMGGALRQLDLIDYPLYMVAMNALPPVPAVFGDDWCDEWQRRVDATPAWLAEWLGHPLDGPSWRRGSIRLGPGGAGYERLGCPVMLIAGWADGYRNNTFRTVAEMERHGLPWRLLAGPWVHQGPTTALPGPNVDDDALMIAWFHQHLRGGPGLATPPGQVYVRAPADSPAPDLAVQPGVWRDLDGWPASGARTLALAGATAARRAGAPGWSLPVRGDVGWAAWNSCGGSLPWGQPLEQSLDNARSLCFDWPVSEAVEVPASLVGAPVAGLRVCSDQAYGHLSVKLCDVSPDGTSALVTRGYLDLTHRGVWPADDSGEPGRQPSPLVPSEWIDVAITLEATTWTLVPGHHLRLAIAGTDWPNCWPPPGPLTIDVDPEHLTLSLPLADLPESAPLPAGAGATGDAREGAVWKIEHDVLGDATIATTRYGGPYDGSYGAQIVDDYQGEVGVSTTDPGRAWARGASAYEVTWPLDTGTVNVRTEATLLVESHGPTLTAAITLRVWHNGDPFAERTWNITR
ncbi:MAG TPA: CocE/NonD family hydrolase [Ilumatobacter sp.]|nr:CocE/NonD family hydrolase [Ilumatobacter sp.]